MLSLQVPLTSTFGQVEVMEGKKKEPMGGYFIWACGIGESGTRLLYYLNLNEH